MAYPISVTILTKNSQTHLESCLNALRGFGDIVILDNGSTDSTMEIAARYSNVRIIEHPFIGFGPLKNLAITHAHYDWILSIDSDEIADISLINEISSLELSDPNVIYSIPRNNYYNGRLVRCCGWYPDRVLRLFNRSYTRFNDAQVHESLILKGEVKITELKGHLNHFSFANASELIDKMQTYSTLYANQSSKHSSPSKAFWRALFAFIKNYLLQKGFLCGYEGLLISISNANGVFYKYIKLYEKNRS